MKKIMALILCGAILFGFAGCSNKPPRGDFDYMPSEQSSSSQNVISERDMKPTETTDNSSSEPDKYRTTDITSGDAYNAIQKLSPHAKLVESYENSTGIKGLSVEITTDKSTLLENAREFVHQMDSIRKQDAKQLIGADYITLSFTHTIPDQKDNYLRFSFEKKGDKYYVSDDETTELTAALSPDYAKAFAVALDDMK